MRVNQGLSGIIKGLAPKMKLCTKPRNRSQRSPKTQKSKVLTCFFYGSHFFDTKVSFECEITLFLLKLWFMFRGSLSENFVKRCHLCRHWFVWHAKMTRKLAEVRNLWDRGLKNHETLRGLQKEETLMWKPKVT